MYNTSAAAGGGGGGVAAVEEPGAPPPPGSIQPKYLAVTHFYTGCPLGDAMFTLGRR